MGATRLRSIDVRVVHPIPFGSLFEGRGEGDGNAYPFEDAGYGKGRTKSKGEPGGHGWGYGDCLQWDCTSEAGGVGMGICGGSAEIEGGGEGWAAESGEEGTDPFDYEDLDDEDFWE